MSISHRIIDSDLQVIWLIPRSKYNLMLTVDL